MDNKGNASVSLTDINDHWIKDDISTYKQSSFTDVETDTYYMGYIEWA